MPLPNTFTALSPPDIDSYAFSLGNWRVKMSTTIFLAKKNCIAFRPDLVESVFALTHTHKHLKKAVSWEK